MNYMQNLHAHTTFCDGADTPEEIVIEAIEALSNKIPLFEVNTGAIARGYRKTHYLSMFILKELKRYGFGAVYHSHIGCT